MVNDGKIYLCCLPFGSWILDYGSSFVTQLKRYSLKVYGEIHVLQDDPGRNLDGGGREVEDAPYPRICKI